MQEVTMNQNPECFEKKLHEAFSMIDQSRLEALNDLMEIQARCQSMFERESTRLADKYGSDHPRAENLIVEFFHSMHATHDSALCTHVDSAKIDICAPGNGMIVAGWVTDLQGKGTGGLRVDLYDKDHQTIDIPRNVHTDADGFFGIFFDPERLPDPPDVGGEIWIEIIDDRSGSRLYTSREPLQCRSESIELLCIRSGEANVQR
jgi:hypothetical protein